MFTIFRNIILVVVICASGNVVAAEKWFEVLGSSWTPSRSNIEIIEVNLKKYVIQHALSHHLKIQPWQMYRFQYQGQGNTQKKEIYINAFCADFGHKDFSHEWLMAKDGGTCFFKLKYLPASDSFADLKFNGEA